MTAYDIHLYKKTKGRQQNGAFCQKQNTSSVEVVWYLELQKSVFIFQVDTIFRSKSHITEQQPRLKKNQISDPFGLKQMLIPSQIQSLEAIHDNIFNSLGQRGRFVNGILDFGNLKFSLKSVTSTKKPSNMFDAQHNAIWHNCLMLCSMRFTTTLKFQRNVTGHNK